MFSNRNFRDFPCSIHSGKGTIQFTVVCFNGNFYGIKREVRFAIENFTSHSLCWGLRIKLQRRNKTKE